MNLKNLYWHFKSALSSNLCDEIVREGLCHKDNMGITGGSKNPNLMTQEDIKDIKLKRDSNIVWLNQPWIYNEILPFVELANKNHVNLLSINLINIMIGTKMLGTNLMKRVHQKD